jgi:hypothetical protein
MNVDGGARRIETLLTAYDADILGLMDLSGWQLARDYIAGGNTLTKKFDPDYRYQNHFTQLETVSFGTFDDGRWARYDSLEDAPGYPNSLYMRCGNSSKGARYGSLIGSSPFGSGAIGTITAGTSRIDASGIWSPTISTYGTGSSTIGTSRLGVPLIDNSTTGIFSAMVQTPGKDVCPSFAIKMTIRDLFVDSKSLVICSTASSAVKLEQKTGLTIIHQKRLESMHSYPLGPTRIYTTTKYLDKLGGHRYLELLVLSLCLDRLKKPFFRSRTPTRDSDVASGSTPSWSSIYGSGRRESALQKVNLEICLAPYQKGGAEHIQLAVDIKNALDKFHKAAKMVDGTVGHWGVLKIFVGDDIPPCPCCGLRR